MKLHTSFIEYISENNNTPYFLDNKKLDDYSLDKIINWDLNQSFFIDSKYYDIAKEILSFLNSESNITKEYFLKYNSEINVFDILDSGKRRLIKEMNELLNINFHLNLIYLHPEWKKFYSKVWLIKNSVNYKNIDNSKGDGSFPELD